MPIGTPVALGTLSDASSTSTVVLTTTAGVTAGDSIIVAFGISNSTVSLSSVTDSAGNTYAIDASKQHTSATVLRIYIASCHNASALASGGTITANLSSATSNPKGIGAITVSGLATASTLDKTNTAEGSGTTWSSGSSGTLAQADELAIGAAFSGTAGSGHAPDSGWTEEVDLSLGSRRVAMVSKIVSATTAQTAGGTWGSASWVGAIATYKAPSSGAALDPSASVTAAATLSITVAPHFAPTSDVAAGATLAVTVAPHLAATADASSSASCAVTFPPTQLDLDPAAATSGATVLLTVSPHLDASSVVTSSASVSLTIPALLTVAAAAASSATIEGIRPVPAVLVCTSTAISRARMVLGLPAQRRSQLKCKLTSLHYPARTDPPAADAQPARTLALLLDATDIEFYHPLNDAREASCVIHFEDPAAQHVKPYETMLHITFAYPGGTDRLVFWGILTQPEWDGESRTIRINAVDPSLRLKHHFLRAGDEALNSPTHATLPNDYDRHVPVGLTGLNMLFDAGENTDEQTARGVPDLGILHNSIETPPATTTSSKLRFERGTQVWEAIQELTAQEGAPDFELRPIDDLEGYYCQLVTAVDLNGDWWSGPPYPQLQDGFGKDNCRINYRPGSRVVTHNHVLSNDQKDRVTVADVDSSADIGVYVQWDVLDAGSPRYSWTDPFELDNTAPLLAAGRRTVGAYGLPTEAFDITPNIDSDVYYYESYLPGSYVQAQARWPYKTLDVTCRVVSCRLRQEDAAANVRHQLEVVYSRGDEAAPAGSTP